MKTKRKQISLVASIIMTVLIALLIVAGTFLLPGLCGLYSRLRGGIDCTELMTALYISVLPGLICCYVLMRLLWNIRKEKLFVQTNVRYLQIISYCCIFVGTEYALICHRHISMLLIAFAALFFGLILRVIKNVFDKAIELREENDYTV